MAMMTASIRQEVPNFAATTISRKKPRSLEINVKKERASVPTAMDWAPPLSFFRLGKGFFRNWQHPHSANVFPSMIPVSGGF